MAQLLVGTLVAQEAANPVLERLDPPRRAAVIMALLGIVLTGLFLVTVVMVGAHWVRRQARQGPRTPARSSPREAAADNRRLRESLGGILPEVNTGDTIQADRPGGETRVDS